MRILATLPNLNPNLFTSLPTQNSTTTSSSSPKPPIPVPKYPPPVKSPNHPPKPRPHPGLKTAHRASNYYKPIKSKEGPGHVLSSDGDRSVIVGESGVSYLLPGAPFEFQFSYSETPRAKPLAIREPAFLPFAPPTMPRPWTGKAPMKSKVKKEKKIRLFESLEANVEGKGMKMEMGRRVEMGVFAGEVAPRRKVIGKPLTRAEITELVRPHFSSNRQVNLGRDGLTHNMLELVHTHWKRRPVCKVRCLGVPTVDMDNVCRCLEEKTGGKIIHRVGGIVYIFRGRNYDPRTRPRYPVMLWKPATPVYPKLIREAPEGLTKDEADKLREKGNNLLPICKLAKNGVYNTLVKDVRNAFEGSILVKINCKGLDPSDYKRIGAKLKELVPCVLLSFDNEQILMWRGNDWKSRYPDTSASTSGSADGTATYDLSSSERQVSDDNKSDQKRVISSPKMMSLWKRAIETNKALLLKEIALAPDDLLQIVEEFDGISQATEHSYPAQIITNKDNATTSWAEYERIENEDHSEEEYYSDDEYYLSDSYDEIDSSVPLGSLPVDFIAKQSGDQ